MLIRQSLKEALSQYCGRNSHKPRENNNEQELHSAANNNSKIIARIVIYLFTYFI